MSVNSRNLKNGYDLRIADTSEGEVFMPKSKKKRSSEGPMPAAGAGLIRFFADSSEGVKLGPIIVLILSISLLIVVLLAQFGVFALLGFGL